MRLWYGVLAFPFAAWACGQGAPTAAPSVSPAPAGAFLVKDVNPGRESSNPGAFGPLAERATFWARGGPGQDRALWVTDGTAEGTMFVSWVPPVPLLEAPPVDPFVLFPGSDPEHGNEPWRTDGTARGTALVKDINPGPSSGGAPTWGNSYPSEFTQVNGVWFFAACDEEHGPEVWRSDGTAEGTVLVADIYPGPGRYGPGSWRSICLDNRMPSNLTEMKGTLYFFTDHPAFGREVWRTDGTARGTALLKDTQPGPEVPYRGGRPPEWPDEGDLVRVGETLFFRSGRILWKSDGTEEGTEPVADVLPLLLTPARSLLFFAGPDGLWKSDGTAEGTRLVKDVFISTSLRFDNMVSDMQAVDDLLFFVGAQLESGPELWRSDGTGPGTLLLRDIRPGSASSYPQSLTAVDGALFFSADDGSSGGQLWTSDGTPPGTARLTNLVPGIVRSSPRFPARYFGRAGGVVLFEADDTVHGSELWGYPLGSASR